MHLNKVRKFIIIIYSLIIFLISFNFFVEKFNSKFLSYELSKYKFLVFGITIMFGGLFVIFNKKVKDNG